MEEKVPIAMIMYMITKVIQTTLLTAGVPMGAAIQVETAVVETQVVAGIKANDEHIKITLANSDKGILFKFLKSQKKQVGGHQNKLLIFCEKVQKPNRMILFICCRSSKSLFNRWIRSTISDFQIKIHCILLIL